MNYDEDMVVFPSTLLSAHAPPSPSQFLPPLPHHTVAGTNEKPDRWLSVDSANPNA